MFDCRRDILTDVCRSRRPAALFVMKCTAIIPDAVLGVWGLRCTPLYICRSGLWRGAGPGCSPRGLAMWAKLRIGLRQGCGAVCGACNT